jgi:2-dehydropantoate 2-reductase
MKICVFGAGAIGGLLGSRLGEIGPEVEVSLVARGAHLSAIQAQGLRLHEASGTRIVHLRATDEPGELGPQDYVIIALKANDIPPAVDSILPLLEPGTTIVTASNGLPYWYFHEFGPLAGTTLASVDPDARQWRLLKADRALGCVVYPAAEISAPGEIRHEHGRKFPLGEPNGELTPRLERFHALMQRAGFDAPILSDIRNEIWLKLVGNVCFNPVSALTLATLDLIATEPETRALCRLMMLETKAVGEKVGATLRVDIERRLDGAAAVGPHKMSMLQDLERGRSLEIEPIVGAVQELGRLTGTDTPAVDAVLALVRQRARVMHASLQ